ncbi:MAG TPA: mismatch repair protein [Terriglobales bacterium]
MAPSEEYGSRLAARELRVGQHEKIHIRLGNVRLLLAIITVSVGWLAFGRHMLSPWWLAAPVAAFLALAAYHGRVLRNRDLAERSVTFYKQGVARVEDRWSGVGETGERFDDPHHVYAGDLDLFGEGSLFQLISAARTRIGEQALAAWLLSPAPVEQVLQRQASVSELRDELDLREDLSVLGEDAGVGVHPDPLTKWAEAPNQLQSSWIPRVAPVLAILAALTAFAWGYWGIASPFLLLVVIEGVLKYRLRKPVESVLEETEHAFHDLDLLSGVLARVEAHTFHSLPLQQLQQQLSSGAVPGSQAIAKLRSLVDLIDSRDNLFLKALDVPLMYSVQVAFAAERWRHAHGKSVRGWLAAVGEIEALLSLAGYSYEHPADPFPEFRSGPASFTAEQIGHPLIPAATCVRNDVAISGEERVLLVSGSNMSGKSTLLRSVGMNVVLAMAGAPVKATRLVLTPLHVGASIRINDSLREGSSRFYAEIKRLRSIFDFAGGQPPLLFLLDELLQGTNSNDRRIGADGVVHALLKREAIGLISTHDLSLTEIGSSLNGHLHNVHLQDEIENGAMKFDYKLRDGIVTKSNGLELMRIIGLEV